MGRGEVLEEEEESCCCCGSRRTGLQAIVHHCPSLPLPFDDKLRRMASKERAFYSGSRYASDMQQAQAMRAGTQSRARGSEKKSLSLEDVQLALRGLDQAESLRNSGDEASALKLYGLSLELLIMFLKDEEALKRLPVDHGTVAARVSVALSDAEELKSQLPNNSSRQSSPSSFVAGMIKSLNDALIGPCQPTTQQAAATPGKKVVKGNTRPLNSRTAKSSAALNAATPKKTALHLDNSARNQLYKMVLDDFHVPLESLQNTSWDDIAGLEDVKQSLQESAILPLIRPDLFTGLRKPQNVLLYGPPGTGKTLLVKAVAKESGSSLFVCSASALISKWMGEGEKLVKALFQVARDASPSIIFLDEVDALLSSRRSDGEHEASRRLKTEFMVQMEGITTDEQRVLVLAATNCPWDIDSAVVRRFPRRIFVPLPDASARRALLKNLLKKAGKHSLKKKQQIDELVEKLKGFSCSDIVAIASEASFGPIRSLGGLAAIKGANEKDVRPITSKDFEDAIKKATKSVSKAQAEKFELWRQEQSAN